jgi:hypothetical protein
MQEEGNGRVRERLLFATNKKTKIKEQKKKK